MATAATPKRDFKELGRKVVRFDKVTSFLLASIVLSSFVVAWLSAVWVTNQTWPTRKVAVPVEFVVLAEDGEEGMSGDDPELGENATEETESESPAREESLVFDTPEQSSVISSVLDGIAQNDAEFVTPTGVDGPKRGGKFGGPGGTGKSGTGSGGGGIPRAHRWVIVYPQGQTLEAYARILDSFGIEIGIVRGGNRVTFVSTLAAAAPVVRNAESTDDRLYFIWQDRTRREADRKLALRSGAVAERAIIAQFVPKPVEEKLAQLEIAYKGHKPEAIKTTRFGVRPAGGAYEFYVMEQTLLRP